MLLLSKFFPKFKSKNDKNKGVTSEADLLSGGDKPVEFNCKAILLDDSELALNVKASAKGQAVLDKVYSHLNLIEKDYFGLRFLDVTSQTHWLDPVKTVGTQVKTQPPHKFYFGVKFYAADPCKLHEEITRYQFFLQLKRDILQGRIPVSFELSAELAAYTVQSELGDYDPKRHSLGYISEFRFVPNQTEEIEGRICQLHKMLVGQVPAAAEYRFLDKVKWLEMYGVDLHAVQGEGNIQYFLGLTPTGIVVYRNKNKVGNYFWPRLTKITFKAKFFMIRVRDKNNDENTYAFECSCKAACKHLWKCCIEHHAFFRLTSANESYKSIGGKLFNFGSKYRYSGRTERQVLTESANRPPPKVVRRPSKRHQRRASSEGRIETNYSQLPDPDTDNMVAATMVLDNHKTSRATYQRAEGYQSAPESPRSTRSAPWLDNSRRKRGLYTSGRESPLSVRSEKMMFPKRIASGSESEGAPSRRRGHNRYESEAESEATVTYDARWNTRSRAPADYTESESEAGYRHRQRRHRKSTESLPYAQSKWDNVQQRVREGNNGSVTSMASDPIGGAKKRRNRRSKSGERKPPEELAQHFKYIDPAQDGITEEQMREIGYEQVHVTAMPAINIRTASRSRHKSPRRRSYGELSEKSAPPAAIAPSEVVPSGEAPPPYAQEPSGNSRKSRGRQRSQPNLNYAEPKLRPPHPGDPHFHNPTMVQRQETHEAPIVKTKPVAYASPIAAPLPNEQPSPVTPGENNKHTRDDSGLGAEQDNGSLNSSSRMNSPAASNSSHTLDHSQAQGHAQGYQSHGHGQGYQGQGHPQGYQGQGHPQGYQGQGYHHMYHPHYSPVQPKSSYSEQVLSESTHHHNNVSSSRHHPVAMASNPRPSRYYPPNDMRIPRSRNTYSPPRSAKNHYAAHNGAAKTRSEKMTEL